MSDRIVWLLYIIITRYGPIRSRLLFLAALSCLHSTYNHIALKGFEPISLCATLGHSTLTTTTATTTMYIGITYLTIARL
ncbi:hypothetical protein GGR51DRAFT_533542 [Nemania sp. FL0031]|nr:hypothetical protein GGR51DRAFT_533542 [Nemania sp. FL0031]